jgi:hypothetical protein
MVDVYVDLKQIATGLDKDDLIKVIAAWYAEQVYGVEAEEDDLADVANYITEDDDDVLLSIENTLANLDRQFGEEEDYEDDDYDDEYDDDEYDDDYDDDYDENDDIDAETAHLMEINRRKNEEALGL